MGEKIIYSVLALMLHFHYYYYYVFSLILWHGSGRRAEVLKKNMPVNLLSFNFVVLVKVFR